LDALRNRTTRRIAALAAAVSLAAALIGVTPAASQAQGDTSAVAINTKDGSSIFRLAFSIRRVTGEVVDQTNAAAAVASCEECRTIAVSIQIVLVMGDPTVISPTNLALALNIECTLCETLASAYQFVFGTGEMLRFTSEGLRQLHDIREQIRDLLASDLPIAEIQARLDALMEQLAAVLATQLVPVPPDEDDEEVTEDGDGADEDVGDDTEEPVDGETPAPEESPEESPSPAPTESTTP
jgi:putative peptide zinc metalloprotease protein